MLRPSALLLAVAVLLTSCANRIETKEKVQEAIVNRLQSRSGLDLNSLDISTTAVSFDKNKAYATVVFHPKNNSSLNSGMTMKYTLEDQKGKWVVVKVGNSAGHGFTGSEPHSMPDAPGTALPPGHPPVSGSNHSQAGPLNGSGTDGRSQ